MDFGAICQLHIMRRGVKVSFWVIKKRGFQLLRLRPKII